VSKSASLVRIGIVYVLALAAATAWLAWGPDTRWLWLDALIADLIATVVVFVASRIHRNSSCYDPFWSVLPAYLVVAWWLLAEGAGIDHARAWMLTIVVFVWALRLTANWVQDWPGMVHEDWRYPMLRDRAGPFAVVVDLMAIHVIPTLIVFLGMLPAYAVIARPGDGVNWLDWLALVVGIAAPILQFVADAQMRDFIAVRQPGQAMDRGLWSWSRHPNYFGEISFWVALALFGIAGAPHDWWWLVLGALAMVAMFQGTSIPMMEERSLDRRPSYQEIIDRVPRLVPRPPRRRI
jgi:steroid 5-alpha reductase family enzyme